jgi:hypothetical protein
MNLRVPVPPDTDCRLRVEADGFQPVTMPVHVAAGEEIALPVLLAPIAAPPGKHGAARAAKAVPGATTKPESKPEPKKGDGEFMNPF